jgi:hypothetical protein
MARVTTMRAAFEAAKVAPGGERAPLVKQLVRVMERADKQAKFRRQQRRAQQRV